MLPQAELTIKSTSLPNTKERMILPGNLSNREKMIRRMSSKKGLKTTLKGHTPLSITIEVKEFLEKSMENVQYMRFGETSKSNSDIISMINEGHIIFI